MLTFPPPQIEENIPKYSHPTSFNMMNTPQAKCNYPYNMHYQPQQFIPQSCRPQATVKLNLIPSLPQTSYNQRPAPMNTTLLFGKYSPMELIGKGTFGDIWKIFDVENKKQYAMKMVKQNTNWSANKQKQIELVFIREGKKIMELNNIQTNEMGKHFIINCKEILYAKHENITNKLLNNETYTPLKPCIVMELFGYSLIQYIKLHETHQLKISLKTIRIICIQMVSAMSFLHGIGKSIHCDLKSENILINTDNNYPKIKIIDFGNLLSINKQIKTFNIQTIWYRSPEVLFGNYRHISPLIDVWSVGCILYELYTVNIGMYHRLFECNINDKMQVIYKIFNELSPFSIYIYNQFDSYNFIRQSQIYHGESNYIKLKMNRCYKLMYKLGGYNGNNTEFINFIDLLACLLDLNPITRYTSEDALRHKFIINDEFCKENNSDLIKRVHPRIKSSDDMQRQCRINELMNGYKSMLSSKGNHISNDCDSISFPVTITKPNLY